MNDKVLDTPHYRIKTDKNILFVTYKGRITLAMAKEVVETRFKFTDFKSLPVLVEGISVSAIDKDARDYLSTDEGIKGIKAGAIYVNSTFQSFLGNFFLKVSNPKIPTKIFTDKESAIKWLEQYK